MASRKLVILLAMITFSLAILSTFMFPSKHAISPLFPAFTVTDPHLSEMSPQVSDPEKPFLLLNDLQSIRNLDEGNFFSSQNISAEIICIT